MAKKQTRRSISANARFFDRFKKFCERNEIPMSAFLEFALDGDLSRPLDKAAYYQWRIAQARLADAARALAAKRAKYAAGLTRARASDTKSSNGDRGDA